MDFDNLVDDSAAVKGTTTPAQAPAPQQASPPSFDSLVDDDEKYGTISEQLKAGLEGVARGATLGGSDLAETKLFGVDPAAIKARESANPITSTVGNLVGGAGLVGLTGGLAAPVEAAGLGAETLGGIASKAIQYGAEGAVFGAGNSLSDYALGDPNLNAQKVLSNVGLGALFGATLGAGTGKLEGMGLIGKAVGDVADKANASAETEAALFGERTSEASSTGGGSGNNGNESGGLLKGLNTQKNNAQDIIKAGEMIGAPVTEGMTSDNKWVQQAEDALVNGAPTFSGIRRAKLYEQGYKAVGNTLDSILDTGEEYGGGPMTKVQLGQAMQDSLTSKIANESAPIQEMYEALKPQMQSIDVPKNDLTSLGKDILALPEAKTSFPEGSLAKRVAGDVLNFDSVDDIKNYKSALNRSISPTASPGEKHMAGVLADKLTDLEENSIVKAASDPTLPPEMQDTMRGLIDDRQAANAAYKPFIKNLNSLTEQLGKKNAGGAQTAVNFIQDLDPETLANKLFDKKFSSFNEFFQDKFPEEAALMRQYQKQVLKDAASKTGELSPKVFFNKLNQMEPEIKSAIFYPDELEKINAAETYIRALPKNFNPSGTSGMSAFRAFFESPTGSAIANARDFGIEAFIKAAGALPESARPTQNPFEFGSELADKFNKMSAIQKMAAEADEKITAGAKSIFSSKDAARGAILSGATFGSDKEYNKLAKDVRNLASNPSGIVDHMVHNVGDLGNSLPNVTQGIHTTSIAALNFLNSKLPKEQGNLPLSHEYEPSQAEKAKFVRYFNAVNNPIGVLDHVKNGTLTSESMEALQAVHPELLNQMRQEVMRQMKDKDPSKIPYSIKMSTAKFLGQPLDSSMTPQVIQSNQASLAGPQLGNQMAQGTGRRGQAHALSKLDLSSRTATKTENTEDGE